MSITSSELKLQCKKFVTLNPEWSFSELSNANIRYMLTKCEFRKVGNDVYGFEYNVVYSESYEVPVMYFSIHKQDGSIAELEEVFTDPIAGTVVSQVEHPVLFRPFYQVHPCKTQVFMKHHNVSNYLIGWLSTIGTLIGLKFEVKPQLLPLLET